MTIPSRRYIYLTKDNYSEKLDAIEATPAFKVNIRDKKIKSRAVSLDQIKELTLSGRIINFGAVKNKSVMALDVDNKGPNKLSMEKSKELLEKVGIYPVFYFSTSSSTEDNPRYRIIFVLDNIITDNDCYKSCLRSVSDYLNLDYPDSTDRNTCSANTVFYGCRECLYQDTAAITSLDKLKSLACIINPTSVFKLNFADFFKKVLTDNHMAQKYKLNISKHFDPVCFYNSFVGYTRLSNDIDLLKRLMKLNSYGLLGEASMTTSLEVIKILESHIPYMFSKRISVEKYLLQKSKEGSLELLFGLPAQKVKKNIFYDHNEPLGSILDTDSEYQKYTTYKENDEGKLEHKSTYSIPDIFMKLFNCSTYAETVDKLAKFCNVYYRHYTIPELKYNLQVYRGGIKTNLSSYKSLTELLCHKDNNVTRAILYSILDLADETYDSLAGKTNAGRPQFLASSKLIVEKLSKNYGITLSTSNAQQKINMLTELGLIDRVNPKDYNIYITGLIKKFKSQHYKLDMTSAVIVPDMSDKMMAYAESRAKFFIENCITSKEFRCRDKEKILSNPDYIAADNLIKMTMLGRKYIGQPELTNLYKNMHPDIGSIRAAQIANRYRANLAANNNLVIRLLTKQLARKYKITPEIMKANHYSFNRTKMLIQEI